MWGPNQRSTHRRIAMENMDMDVDVIETGSDTNTVIIAGGVVAAMTVVAAGVALYKRYKNKRRLQEVPTEA